MSVTTFTRATYTWYPFADRRLTAILDPVFNKYSEKIVYNERTYLTALVIHFKNLEERIPKNLNNFAPNMVILDIRGCNLKNLTRKDLKGLENLRNIHIRDMQLKELPSDLFADFFHLHVIDFRNNNIKLIGRNIFKHLKHLEVVDLTGNPSYNVLYSSSAIENYECADNKARRIWKIEQLNAIIAGTDHTGTIHSITLLDDVQKCLKSDKYKDFRVQIDQIEFKVHKFILIARSPTLAKMIEKNPFVDQLVLTDIEADVFKTILDYIYHDKMPKKYDAKSAKVFAAAGKLKLKALMAEVGNILSEAVDEENFFELLTLASKYNHNKLKRESFIEFKMFINDLSLKDEIMEDIELIKEMMDFKKAYEEKLKMMKGKIKLENGRD